MFTSLDVFPVSLSAKAQRRMPAIAFHAQSLAAKPRRSGEEIQLEKRLLTEMKVPASFSN